MTILACGVNHNSAPIAVREKISINDSSHDKWLKRLISQAPIHEAAIISTCNRTELYCETPEPAYVIDWLTQRYRQHTGVAKDYLYIHHDFDAVRHMMRVACGLDSMILGESQILGQIKQAFQRAEHLGTVGPKLSAMFRHTFSVSKRVRTETAIGAFPVSVAYASTLLARRIFSNFSDLRVLVIGAGKTSFLAARHFREQGVRSFTISNRSLKNAERFAEEFDADAIMLSDIPNVLKNMDVVIAATSSELPLVTKSMVEQALRTRRHRMMLFIDLGVPRDIESSLMELEDVFLYNVDDMSGIVEDGLSERRDAAKIAEDIIALELDHYIRWYRSLDSIAVIKQYRERMQTLAEDERLRAKRLIGAGQDPDVVIDELSRRLVDKLMHQPSIRLRRAGYDGREDLLLLAQYLFSEDI